MWLKWQSLHYRLGFVVTVWSLTKFVCSYSEIVPFGVFLVLTGAVIESFMI